MAVSCGFFNSINGDRLYNAIDMSMIFDGIITDGVYMGFMDHLAVEPLSGMTVKVGAGRAWFDHTWTYNDYALPFTIKEPAVNTSRIDCIAIIVDISEEVRNNTIEVIEGEPSNTTPEKPELTDTSTKKYYPLAYITVEAGMTDITASSIENAIGLDRTPFVTGIISYVSAEDMLVQWATEWDEYKVRKRNEYEAWIFDQMNNMTSWKAGRQADYDAWISEHENSFEEWELEQEALFQAWLAGKKLNFDDWFANLNYILDGDVAGHLQVEIEEIWKKEFERYYDLYSGTVTIYRNLSGEVSKIVTDDGDVIKTTNFQRVEESDEGSYTVITTTIVVGVDTYTRVTTVRGDEISSVYTKS